MKYHTFKPGQVRMKNRIAKALFCTVNGLT